MPIAMLALASVLAGAEPRPAAAGDLDPDRVPWKALRYEARKLFLKATTEVRLADPRRLIAGELAAGPRGAALEPPGRVSVIELESSLVGRRSETEVWFDPGTAAVFQQRKQRYGKKAYEKTYRFTGDGVASRRRSPRSSDEGRQPPARWGRLEQAFYPYPKERGGCLSVAEPTTIFYLLAAAELAAGQPLAVCVFSRRALSRVEVRPAGAATLEVDYAEIQPGERRRRTGEVVTQKVTVRARPLDGGDDFEFLGLEGDVEIFLAGGVPVEVRGRLPRFGRVQVKLVEVDLRSSSR